MITQVQSTGKQTGTNSLVLSLAGVAQGNTIVVFAMGYRALGQTGITVTSSAGTFSCDEFSFSTTTVAAAFRLTNASAGSHSITVTGSSMNLTAIAIELHSSFTPNRIFKDASNRGTGTSAAPSVTGTAMVAIADSMSYALVAAAASSSQASIAVATSPVNWVEVIEHLATSSATPGELDSFLATTRGSLSASWTLATSVSWAAIIVTYCEVYS